MSNPQDADVEDSEFFLRLVIFKAESTLFSVPREYLPAGGGIFESMFSLPNLNGEGTSKENPIVLPEDVTAADFHSFLKACLPLPGSFNAQYLTVEEWMSVLKLSAMWCLDDLRARAIESADGQIKEMPDVVDRILLARRHNVSQWLIDGYEILGKRASYLSGDEQTRLGLPTAVKLSELREQSWSWYSTHNRYGGSRDIFNFVFSVHDIFGFELSLDKDYYDPRPQPQL
ncbi:hypothetical protein PENSPDRAFT_682138 [Peniophora sp. CONT]|nr:hypothetical protein PENSPDRAFT_682138 [Peniophora sp. CONT]